MGRPTKKELEDELAELRLRLEEAEDTLDAIRRGEIDALVVSGPEGEQIFTLRGADHAYRTLVETINEGAATLTKDGKIVFANRKMAELLNTPLEKVIGASIQGFLFPFDTNVFDYIFSEAQRGASKGEVHLRGGGAIALFSLNRMPAGDYPDAIALVATDLSELKSQERLLHYLTEQYSQARGEERQRLAEEIHGGLGHELLQVKHSLKSLDDMLQPAQAPLKEPVQQLAAQVNTMIDTVWRLYYDLSPKDLEDVSLMEALDLLFYQLRQDKGLKIAVEKDDITDLFATEAQIIIHRVLRELLTCIQKYCEATEVGVGIKRHPRKVDFSITHNGSRCGESALQSPENILGICLMAVNEWVNVLGGNLQILNTKGDSSTLIFTLPLKPKALAPSPSSKSR